ncbi:patatin-like phospholipase family protein [Vibrio parahaemolyticus]|nr:patatin-like phospholipase family protein [Vibrio parahaemolyticus]
MALNDHLSPQDRESVRHKMLALDGGGIRGIITLEVLAEMERQLALKTGQGADFRLCDFFDYVSGTSTGAIIAAGIARGLSTQELLEIYKKHGEEMFDKTFLINRLKAFYKGEPLEKLLKKKLGEKATLEPEYLKCLLLIVTKNLTTDSPWPISSNPNAKFNDLARPDCNLKIPLWQLVRASTAAPVYFPPEVLQWDESDSDKTFVFVDGGMTPYNNPAFLLYQMATQPVYRLNWQAGEDKMLIVSIGTGNAAICGPESGDAHRNLFSNITGIPGGLMYAASVEQDINCRMIGRCVYGAPIDRELGDLIPREENGDKIPLSKNLDKAFLYARYNAELSRSGLDALGLRDVEPEQVQKLDSIKHMNDLARIGQAVAKSFSLEHFGAFV